MLNSKKPWKDLKCGINPLIIQTLTKLNFPYMMPVQQAAIPLLLKNYDIAVEAQTGSGKTLSFLIPLLQKLLAFDQNKLKEQSIIYVKFVVLAPTRQLCQQTFTTLQKILKNMNNGQDYLQYCQCTTGGKPIGEDINKIKDKCLVMVGTVGRVKELGDSMAMDWLKKVDYLYIDEADRVIKEKGIEQLIKCFQKMRRTAMFSATLAGLQPSHYQFYGMRNLAKISLKPLSEHQGIKNYVIPNNLNNTYLSFTNRQQKIYFLIQYLHNFHMQTHKKLIIFFNTCASVDFYSKLLTRYLQQNNKQLHIVGLHGKLKTKRRKHLLDGFMNAKKGCLIATDVVSRGIDFDKIDNIVQVDPPEDPDNYVHRIGRTARLDRPGTALLLLQNHQTTFLNYLQNKSVSIHQAKVQQFIDCQMGQQEIKQCMMNIMVSDRDYVQKSKKAFVSYLRSYLQHDLKYIFQFKNMSIGHTANSFFLLRIPRVKQILGKKVLNFQQSVINPDDIPWIDKNQQLQFLRKKQHLALKKQQQEKIKMRSNNQDIKNDKSQRKRRKIKNERLNLKELNKEHKLIRKEKLGLQSKKKNYSYQYQDQQQSDCDDEELQRRIINRND